MVLRSKRIYQLLFLIDLPSLMKPEVKTTSTEVPQSAILVMR